MKSVPNSQSWGIVGGGILGMTLALRLAIHGQCVTLFEGASQLGGLASTWQLGDIVWDRYRYRAPSFDFECELVYDESGLVLDYPGIATRAA